MKETLNLMGVATMCVNLAYERVKESWPAVLVKLKDNFGPDFKVFDERYALLDISLLLIACEIHYIRRNYPKEQAESIEQSIIGIIEMQDNGIYSLAEVNEYMKLDSKEMSSKLLFQLIRDEKKFAVYKISDIDLRRTWETIKPLTSVASFVIGINSNDLLASTGYDSEYRHKDYLAEAHKILSNDPEHQALSMKLQELKVALPQKRTLASLKAKKLSLNPSAIPTPRTTRQQIKLKPREPKPIIYQRENMNLPVELTQSPPTPQVTEKALTSKSGKQLPSPLPRISGNLPVDVPLARRVKKLVPVKREPLTRDNRSDLTGDPSHIGSIPTEQALLDAPIGKPKVAVNVHAQVRATKRNGILRGGKWMKNWRLPGIILILLFLAIAFRWSIVSSQVNPISSKISSTVKFKKDNWNSALYKQIYTTDGKYNENRVNGSPIVISSESLTFIWGGLTGINVIWLLYGMSKTKKKNTNENNSINT